MSPYEVLGLAPGASLEEAKRAHRRLVMRYHPDRPEGNAVKFHEIREAYRLIERSTAQSILSGFGSAMKSGTKVSPW